MVKPRTLSLLALFACIFAFCVIGLGAFTRLMDAGLGCPDWPGCYGHLTAPLVSQVADAHYVTYKAWAEMIHRYFAGTLSLLILTIVIISFTKNCRNKKNIFTAIVLIALIIYQIILGQLTVTLKLLPLIVTQHLLGGFLIISVLWLVHLNNKNNKNNNKNSDKNNNIQNNDNIKNNNNDNDNNYINIKNNNNNNNELYSVSSLKNKKSSSASPLSPKAFPLGRGVGVRGENYCALTLGAFLALIILFTQIFLGAWTSTNYASLSCPDFPFCINSQVFVWHLRDAFNLISPVGVNYEGGVLPEAVRQTIQMTHRIGALVFTSYILLFSLFAREKIKHNFEILKSLFVVFGLLSIQLCLGISNVVFKLPIVTAVCHNLVAVLLLLAVITLTYKIAHTACARREV